MHPVTTIIFIASLLVTSSGTQTSADPYSYFCDSTNSAAITNVVTASEDAVLFEDRNDISAGRNKIIVGRTPIGLRRSLLRFDLSDINLPADARVLCAEMYVYTEKGYMSQVSVHAVTSPWSTTSSNELKDLDGGTAVSGDATWTYAKYPSIMWDTLGGDFELTPFVSSFGGSGNFFNKNGRHWFGGNDAMKSKVQQWLDGSSPNYGVALLGNEAYGTADDYNIYDGIGSAPSYVPKLVITYTSPSGSGATLQSSNANNVRSGNNGGESSNLNMIMAIVMCSLVGVMALIGGFCE
eukprot:CAMPEP_0172500306 /NCGR_PEP_ID=MMETSP1066-20121228/136680_1 /TAXON_ID=671091 /ORGANISM="Coscinodiscus wailesii, Strain CCMP2513" /LENGTH=294 /DNA_ID=CAMNT_0013274465 /DNA_START=64 /DNA_END=945 /DNA_ORIENTATION=-